MKKKLSSDETWMREALSLAKKALGATSPNPLVGAILVRNGRVIGRGWHHAAGRPHAEIEALNDAVMNGNNPAGATLYVTLEPCSTHGRTPPCTSAIAAAGIKKIIVAATDPNPHHSGKGFAILEADGIKVLKGLFSSEADRMNESFNHWIVNKTPFVTVKAAMTLDGKIATADGESKWITGEKARLHGMKLRSLNDAVLVGINTILKDDPSLTIRSGKSIRCKRRIILDSYARTPLDSKVISDKFADLATTVVVSPLALKSKIKKLGARVKVVVCPLLKKRNSSPNGLDLRWLMKYLGAKKITSLLVEGGGEVNASFIETKLAHRVAFFYAPKILGGRDAKKAVAGEGIRSIHDMILLDGVEWKKFDEDLFLTARILPPHHGSKSV